MGQFRYLKNTCPLNDFFDHINFQTFFDITTILYGFKNFRKWNKTVLKFSSLKSSNSHFRTLEQFWGVISLISCRTCTVFWILTGVISLTFLCNCVIFAGFALLKLWLWSNARCFELEILGFSCLNIWLCLSSRIV
jgi:hypothetical protein